MGRLWPPLLFAIILSGGSIRDGVAIQPPGNARAETVLAGSTVALPAGSKVAMALTRPVWAKTAKPGDILYLQTVFPVTVGNRIGIPAGTYVQGTIDSILAPTRKISRAEIDVHFDQIIFANGYTVILPGAGAKGSANGVAAAISAVDPLTATLSMVTVQVSRTSDILLDNGSQIEMTLEAPLLLDAARVAQAASLSHAPAPGQFKSATMCRPTPGDPGTPGSPGTPGTPSTVIPGTPATPGVGDSPGVPGTPDTVIPGTPGTPGIPGTPGTQGTACPSPPLVISSASGGVTVKQNANPPYSSTK